LSEVNYRVATPLLTQTKTLRYSPDDGVLNSAVIHFPPGTNSLVEVFVYIGVNQVLPTPVTGGTGGNVGIALHATTQSFNINLPVRRGDPLEVVISNHDEDNPHTISVVLLIET